MKIKWLYFLVLVAGSFSTNAQGDTLNQFDGNNNKTGWWVTHLDRELAETDDEILAKYFKYSYFDGKFDYFNIGKIGTKKNPVITPDDENHIGIAALDGEYKAEHNNGKIRFVLSAKKGRLIEYLEYYPSGILKTRFDYTVSCGETELHYCIYQYEKDGSLKRKSTLQTP